VGVDVSTPNARRGLPEASLLQIRAALRERFDGNVTDLAKAARVDRSYTSEIVNGNRSPGLKAAQRLALALRVATKVLLPEIVDGDGATNEEADRIRASARARDATLPGANHAGVAQPDVPTDDTDDGEPVAAESHWNVEHGEIIEPQRSGRGRWAIYDGAGAGNPIAPDESARPLPVDRVDLKGDKARVVGPNGFGVRVRGESMSMWEFHTGDVVWVNPDMEVKPNHPNLFLFRKDGREGFCLKVLKHNGVEDYLEADGEDGPGEPIPLKDVTPIGPVVRHDRSSVPRRRDILSDQANLVDRLRRDQSVKPMRRAG
jgi:transcriptional regulator with XRE-family HTH domain